jgi:stalled ribosome rescue protein Dom34
MKKWKKISNFVEIKSPWLTIIGEKWQDHQQKILDYWRIEKADSVIILTLWQKQLILPISVYRVGIDEITLDFAGGRIKPQQSLEKAVDEILQRELNLNCSQLNDLTLLNEQGWVINSSFSNQKLYGFVAEIKPEINIDHNFVGAIYPCTKQGITELLKKLSCLQCRSILLEWLRVDFD